jgi:hypothetical protein
MNTFLPKDYVDNTYAIYNEKERACLLEGKFVSIDSGLVFPDYNPARNKLDTDLYEYARDTVIGYDKYGKEQRLTIYIGQDFNSFGNNAIAFCIIKQAIIAIKDYEFPDIRRAPEVFRYDFPQNDIVWIPDMTNAFFVVAQPPLVLPMPEMGQNELLTIELTFTINDYKGMSTAIEPALGG